MHTTGHGGGLGVGERGGGWDCYGVNGKIVKGNKKKLHQQQGKHLKGASFWVLFSLGKHKIK